MIRTALLLTVLLALPLAVAETTIVNPSSSTPSTMYFHVNGFLSFPINTQDPEDLFARDPVVPAHSACLDDPTDLQGYTSNQYHDWYGFLTPATVEYEVNVQGRPWVYTWAGMAHEAMLDTNVEPTMTWFLEAKTPYTPASDLDAPVPQVVVRATVREGNQPDPTSGALDGAIIAAGQSEPAFLAGALSSGDHVTAYPNGNTTVYGFTFPLSYETDIVPATGFNVLVEAFIDNPLCQGESGLMPDGVDVYSSPDYRPNLTWNIMNPLRIEELFHQFVGDDLVIHAAMSSPWGSYDIQGDVQSEPEIRLEITGPSNATSLSQVARLSPAFINADLDEPVRATWLWDLDADDPADGDYTINLTVRNDQTSAVGRAENGFCLPHGCVEDSSPGPECGSAANSTGHASCPAPHPKEAPGAGGLLAMALVAAVAILRRK